MIYTGVPWGWKMDDLTIPEFMQRTDEPQDANETSSSPPTMEQLLETIRKLSAKKAEISETIIGLKKQIRCMVGKL